MKTTLALLSLGLSISAHAASIAITWGDFEIGNNLILRKDLIVSTTLTIKAGSEFFVDRTETLDPVAVMAFTLHLAPCTQALDLGVINMTMISDNAYGFEYAQHCKTTLYVEFKDLNKESLFTLSP